MVGGLWSSLAGLASKALPMVIPLAKKAAAPLASGALSVDLASQLV